MLKLNSLLEEKKQTIRQQYDEFCSYRRVARLNCVSARTVRSVVHGTLVKEKKGKPGRRPALTQKQINQIKQSLVELWNGGYVCTAKELQDEFELNYMTLRTVQRHLKKIEGELIEEYQSIQAKTAPTTVE